MELFATRLRERSAQLGISLAEAARRIGLSERRFTNYVNGNREPDLATLVRIADVLQSTPNDLLTNDDGRKPSTRTRLLERLNSAAKVLGEDVLTIVVIQAEALAAAYPPSSQSAGKQETAAEIPPIFTRLGAKL